MTPPKTPRALRRSVTMRVAMLFVACTLPPLGGLAWLTFDRTTRELDAQARARLHHDAKAAAMAGIERLDLFDRRLRGVAVLGDAVTPANIQDLFGDHALDIGILNDDGSIRAVRGAPNPPSLDEQRARHLAQAGSLIVRTSRPGAPLQHWMWVARVLKRSDKYKRRRTCHAARPRTPRS